MKMIRIGDQYVLMVLESGQAPFTVSLSEDEAADIHSQLGALLPESKLNVALGSSDEFNKQS